MTVVTLASHDAEQIKANRAAWFERLTKNEDRQTTGVLHRTRANEPVDSEDDGEPIGYCCLGIACDMIPGIKREPYKVMGTDYGTEVFGEAKSEGGLPYEAALWLGVTTSDPYVDLTFATRDTPKYMLDRDPNVRTHITCAGMNDDWGLTFPQIADMIRYFGFSPKHDVLQGADMPPEDRFPY